MIDLVLLIILLYFILFYDKSNYVNYEKPFENIMINCPNNYSINYEELQNYKKITQPYGYSSNEYIDKTRFIVTDKPLPTNPDFFI